MSSSLNQIHRYYLEHAPFKIKSYIKDRHYKIDHMGMSGSLVFMFDDCVLKIQPHSVFIKREILMLNFLKDKLPVPHIIHEATCDHVHYLLMTKVLGEMATSKHLMSNHKQLIELLAQGLKMFWQIPVDMCPIYVSQLERIKEGEMRYLNHLINEKDLNDSYLAKFGLTSIPDLICWLYAHIFEDVLFLSHGDYCLPNVLIRDENALGFIDLGRSGAASKWQDIALCYRSLVDNFEGVYKELVYKDFDANDLFKTLDITPDWDKIWFYILLDELF